MVCENAVAISSGYFAGIGKMARIDSGFLNQRTSPLYFSHHFVDTNKMIEFAKRK